MCFLWPMHFIVYFLIPFILLHIPISHPWCLEQYSTIILPVGLWWWSVWCAGVGLFVCLHGVVAREVRQQTVTKTTVRQYFSSVLYTIRSVIPLVVLGCARLVATWGVQYQEHVSEYGVHWNFFFTLAIVKVSYCLVPCLLWCNYKWSCCKYCIVVKLYHDHCDIIELKILFASWLLFVLYRCII